MIHQEKRWSKESYDFNRNHFITNCKKVNFEWFFVVDNIKNFDSKSM